MKPILLALDFTANGDRAFNRAAQLAEQHDAVLILTHVVSVRSTQAERSEALDQLRSFRAPAGVTVEHVLSSGTLGKEVIELATERDAALIVLGAHRRSPLIDLFLDTVAHSIIRQCRVPVLIVKNRCTGPYDRVLTPTDFSSSARRAFRAAVQIAKGAKFDMLHVYQTPYPAFIRLSEEELKTLQENRLMRIRSDAEDAMREMLDVPQNSIHPMINYILERSDVDAGIAAKIRELKPDLLAMGLMGSGYAALGGRTRAYIENPVCDLLVSA